MSRNFWEEGGSGGGWESKINKKATNSQIDNEEHQIMPTINIFVTKLSHCSIAGQQHMYMHAPIYNNN